MNALEFVSIAVAGGFGAALRLALDAWVRSRTSGILPWGTIAINLMGSFAIGVLIGVSTPWGIPESVHLVFGLGLLGGFTTFSTISVETVELLRERRYVAGFGVSLGVLILSASLAGAGWWLGALL